MLPTTLRIPFEREDGANGASIAAQPGRLVLQTAQITFAGFEGIAIEVSQPGAAPRFVSLEVGGKEIPLDGEGFAAPFALAPNQRPRLTLEIETAGRLAACLVARRMYEPVRAEGAGSAPPVVH